MTRYSLPVMLSEQFYAVVIMPSKDITMQDFILPDAFCSVPAACPTLALRGVPEKNQTSTSTIWTTITVQPTTFTEQSGGISCKAV